MITRSGLLRVQRFEQIHIVAIHVCLNSNLSSGWDGQDLEYRRRKML